MVYENGECLKLNQEEVKIIKVYMDQEYFDFAITVAKKNEKCAAGDDPGMANHIVGWLVLATTMDMP